MGHLSFGFPDASCEGSSSFVLCKFGDLDDERQRAYTFAVLEGLAGGPLTVLEARGLSEPPEATARILSTHDALLLRAWIARALTATSLSQLFGDD